MLLRNQEIASQQAVINGGQEKLNSTRLPEVGRGLLLLKNRKILIHKKQTRLAEPAVRPRRKAATNTLSLLWNITIIDSKGSTENSISFSNVLI
jgi:hypothetical protein